MTTQSLQWLVVASSVVMHVAAFLSVRARLWPCLRTDTNGMPLLDFFALTR
jgi:hypothetical protein